MATTKKKPTKKKAPKFKPMTPKAGAAVGGAVGMSKKLKTSRAGHVRQKPRERK